MGAAKWKSRCTENKERSKQETEAEPQAFSSKGAETAAALLLQKTNDRQAALHQDNSPWTGDN